MTPVVWLDEVDRRDVPLVGGKAANLGEMLRAGLPVPAGFVVTTEAYGAHIAQAGLDARIAERLTAVAPEDARLLETAAAEVSSWVLSAQVPQAVGEVVRSAYRELAARAPTLRAVAVRSSATAEDLADASFAGQQETYLGIAGPEDLLVAVRRCWASLWSPRAVLYRARLGCEQEPVGLAVVVQVLVDAEVAGVLFTCDPVDGARDRFVVSASYGLGEAVVAGTVTPDTFVLAPDGRLVRSALGSKDRRIVPGGGATRVEDVAPGDRARLCMDQAGLAALAALGRRAMEHYRTPQDIEWALAGGRLHLLQTRPVTALAPAHAEPPPARGPGRLAKMFLGQLADRLPEPLTPLDLSVTVPLIYGGLFGLLADFGMKVPQADHGLVELPDGRFAIRPRLPSLRPAMLWRLPSVLVRAAREDPMTLWGPVEQDLRRGLERLAQTPLDALDVAGFSTRLREFQVLMGSILMRRFRALLPGLIHEAITRLLVRRAVGRRLESATVRQLYLDLPYRTAVMNHDLAQLAEVLGAHGRESSAFAQALQAFLAEWGDRPARGMEPAPSFPTWREDPRPVLALVDALRSGKAAPGGNRPGNHGSEAFSGARTRVLQGLGRLTRPLFMTSLKRARGLTLAREDSLFAFEGAIAWLRQVVVELGYRLANAGLMSAADDVFYLTASELDAAARGAIEVRERVSRRRRAYGRVAQAFERGENWLIASGTLPPDQMPSVTGGGHRLSGLPASGGLATGPARLVRGPEEFAHLRQGDVLVCRATSPTWTPLFKLAAAVVTDIGSPLSHAAIVAREYNIPAVVATGHATSILHDGAAVTVNGDAGWVSVAQLAVARDISQ